MARDQFITAALAIGAAFFLFAGIWAFVAPHSFYEQVAEFPPYNKHFVHDIGAFQIGMGAALLLALLWNDTRFVVLAGASVGAVMHLIAHIIDHGDGGNDSDVPLFALVAILLIAAAAARWRCMPRAG